jgi:hypothetical protein
VNELIILAERGSGGDGFGLIAIGFILYCIFSTSGKDKGKKDK